MAKKFTTRIISNGSKWAGESPDPIEALFQRLQEHALDPRFEACGDFLFNDEEKGFVHAWGNFYELSAVFDVRTNDPAIVRRLGELIRVNKETQAYRDARRAMLARG